MANFEISFNKTISFEGGFTLNANDNGNWTGGKRGIGELVGTNYGITCSDMREFLGHTPTIQEMKNMNINTAKSIYVKKYWNCHNLTLLNNQRMADEIFDTGVNCGTVLAGKYFQRVLNLLTKNNLTVDGKIGSSTISFFNNLKDGDKYLVWKLFNALQGGRYINICENNESQEMFIRSWASRVFEN